VLRWLRTVFGARVPQLEGDVPLDVPWLDPGELLAREEGTDVVAQVRLDGEAMGLLASADLKASA
jgi:hypothetical protein